MYKPGSCLPTQATPRWRHCPTSRGGSQAKGKAKARNINAACPWESQIAIFPEASSKTSRHGRLRLSVPAWPMHVPWPLRRVRSMRCRWTPPRPERSLGALLTRQPQACFLLIHVPAFSAGSLMRGPTKVNKAERRQDARCHCRLRH